MNNIKFVRIAKILILVLGVLAILLWFLSRCEIGKDYLDNIVLRSPDDKYTLIVKEWDTIGAGGADIYYSPQMDMFGIFTFKLGEIHTDYGVHPFHNGNYVIDWNNNSVVIHYRSGRNNETDNPNTWEKVCYKIP